MASVLDNAYAEIKKQAAKATSLEPQEQSLGEIAAEFGVGLLPGVGQAMSMRDFERARREDSKLGMALAAVGMLPFGRVIKGGKDIMRKLHVPTKDTGKAQKAVDTFEKGIKGRSPLDAPPLQDKILREQGVLTLPDRYGSGVSRTRAWDYVDPGKPNNTAIESVGTKAEGNPIFLADVFPKAKLKGRYGKTFEETPIYRSGDDGGMYKYYPSEGTPSGEIHLGKTNDPTRLLQHEGQHALTNTARYGSMRGRALDVGTSPRNEEGKLARILQELRGTDTEKLSRQLAEQYPGVPAETWKNYIGGIKFEGRSTARNLYRKNAGEFSSELAEHGSDSPFSKVKTDAGTIFTPQSMAQRITSSSSPKFGEDLDRLHEMLVLMKSQ